jgi:hypothetical protein
VGRVVVIAEGRRELETIFEADELPARQVAIASVTRIAEESQNAVRADQFKKRRAFDGPQQANLLVGVQRRDALRAGKQLRALRLRHFEPARVNVALVTIESGERSIDEIDDACFARSRGFIAGNNLARDSFDFLRFLSAERAETGRDRGVRGFLRVCLCGKNLSPVRGKKR